MFANVTQVFISLEALLLRVAMLPDASILARWNQNLHFRRVRLEHLIDSAFIVRSVCRTRKKSWFDLFQHLLHDRIITHAVLRQHRYLDLAVIGVGTHMQFAPSAALGISMLANLPFPFPVDFQARAIQHQVQTLGGFLGQSYSKLLA